MDVITSFKKAERTIQETIPGKITERGILKHTSVHMKKVTFCLPNLVSFRDQVTGCAGERSAAAGIYLDFSSGFDTIFFYSMVLVSKLGCSSLSGWTNS